MVPGQEALKSLGAPGKEVSALAIGEGFNITSHRRSGAIARIDQARAYL